MSAIILNELTRAAGDTVIGDFTAAAVAASAYKSFQSPYPAGWDLVLRETTDPSGYDALTLHHPASRTLIIANRGTEFTSFKDWKQNFGAAIFGHAGTQIPVACKVLQQSIGAMNTQGLAVDRLLFVGHSLRGALAEAQGLLCLRYIPDRLKAAVNVVGVASAGFGAAIIPYAEKYAMEVYPRPQDTFTHYVRREDLVPHHPGRVSLGRQVELASLYQALAYKPHKSPSFEYRRDSDRLANHSSATYLEFWNDRDDCFIWLRDGQYQRRDGVLKWSRGLSKPTLGDLV